MSRAVGPVRLLRSTWRGAFHGIGLPAVANTIETIAVKES